MTAYTTLTEALEARRASNRSITYIEGEQSERVVSFTSLYDRALGILYHLQARGLAPGDKLVILLNSNEQFIDAFWACLLGGIIPVPVALGTTDEQRLKLFRIWRKLENPLLCTNRTSLDRLSSFVEANELTHEFSRLRRKAILLDDIDDISKKGQKCNLRPDDIAFIQFSSGSTSEPRGIVLSHRNLLVNIKAIIKNSHMTEKDSFLSWMPLTHDMGLIGFHFTPLMRNVNHYLLPADLFIRRPQLWLLKASEKKASILCSPNFGYKHFLKTFNPEKSQRLDLSQVRLIFNGAEPISVNLCREFMETMASYGLSRTAMFTVYGLAEASLAVTFPTVGEEIKTVTVDRHSINPGGTVKFLGVDGQNAVSLVSVGRPIDDCRVRIAGDTNEQLEENVVGHIQIAGGNVTKAYYGDDPSNRTVFTSDGWLDTGDLGFITAAKLIITGRSKDIIFVNGQNYFPHDLEALLEQRIELGKVAFCGVRNEGAAIDEVLAFVLFRGDIEDFIPLAKYIRQRINEQTGLAVMHVIPVKKIPKTTSGKIQRYLLGESYQRREFTEILATLEQALSESQGLDADPGNEVEKTLQEICGNFVVGGKLGIHDNIFEIGTSSFTLAQIYERIEKVYPNQLDITDFFDYPSIAELAAYIEGKVNLSLRV